MESKVLKRTSTKEFAAFNGFERAVLEGRISSLGYGLIAIPAMQTFSLEKDAVADRIKVLLESFAFPPAHVVFYSASLNPFINQLIAHGIYVVEVEKSYLETCFDALRAGLKNRVLLNPSTQERIRYYEKGLVCLYPLMSKSPVDKNGSIRIEKLVVDLLVSPRYSLLFSGSDIAQAICLLTSNYALNYHTLFAYASRKRKAQEVYSALESIVEDPIKEVLHVIQEKL